MYSLKTGKPYQSKHVAQKLDRSTPPCHQSNHQSHVTISRGWAMGTIPNWKFIALETTNGWVQKWDVAEIHVPIISISFPIIFPPIPRVASYIHICIYIIYIYIFRIPMCSQLSFPFILPSHSQRCPLKSPEHEFFFSSLRKNHLEVHTWRYIQSSYIHVLSNFP